MLTSLYPLGIVPEISSVDVKQPAGQYLLRRKRERHNEYIGRLDHCTNCTKQNVIYLNSASGKSVPLSRQVIRSAKDKQTVSEQVSLHAPANPSPPFSIGFSLSGSTTTSNPSREFIFRAVTIHQTHDSVRITIFDQRFDTNLDSIMFILSKHNTTFFSATWRCFVIDYMPLCNAVIQQRPYLKGCAKKSIHIWTVIQALPIQNRLIEFQKSIHIFY